ncbi:alpha/beta hydrolase fold domain-containing protein [Nocardia sp. NPDC057353]|uniref:alpha/beta hydrolase n=1 Tax=Nocardia sp. NPDC057353 TaxID=3346104 RepID=UPI0036457300
MTYAIDPELATWLPRLAPVDFGDPAGARAALRAITAAQPPYSPRRPVTSTDERVPGGDRTPPIPIRVYRPSDAAGPLPGLLYLHGGGFVLGDLDTTHSTALRIADRVGAVVVSVDYRLAPEHRYPAGLEDCYAALTWTFEQAGTLGVDPARIGVAGESAGGGLAAALTLLARDRGQPPIAMQCLIFPELDDRLATVSATTFVDTPKFDRAAALHSWHHYLGPEHPRGGADVPAYAAPARATDLRALPPAFVSVCEFDPLRDEGLGYARRLIEAGVRTELRYYPGTFHASMSIGAAAISRRMVTDQDDALRQGLRALENDEGLTG